MLFSKKYSINFLFLVFGIASTSHSMENPQIPPFVQNMVQEAARVVGQGMATGLVQGAAQGIAQAGPNAGHEFAQAIGQVVNEAMREITNNIGTNVDLNLLGPIYGGMQRHALKMAGIFAVGAAGYAGCYFGTQALVRYLERVLKRPTLILATSYKSPWQRLKGVFSSSPTLEKPLVFSDALQADLERLTTATKRTTELIESSNNNVMYSNMLFYGPPGTGKTEFAKKLAKESGMAWAIVSGSGFSKFSEKQGIIEIDKLFDWAKKQNNGLLLFIDEAESFLMKRENLKPDSKEYKLLTNFLNHTGEQSNKFLIVYASNHPEMLDKAVTSRTGEMVEFTLPEPEQRKEIIRNYVKLYLTEAYEDNAEILASINTVMTEETIAHIADTAAVLAPRDLAILISNIAKDMLATKDGLLSREVVNKALNRMLNKKNNTFKAYGPTAAAAA